MERVGAVIVFADDLSKEQAEFVLEAISSMLESVDVREFDDDEGGPVFYIP